MFQDLNIDFDMLDANENYFLSAYITDFNSFEMKSINRPLLMWAISPYGTPVS